jgi:hypothetical protein
MTEEDEKLTTLSGFVEQHRGLLTTGSLLVALFSLTGNPGVLHATGLTRSVLQFILLALIATTFLEVLVNLFAVRGHRFRLLLFGMLLACLFAVLSLYWFFVWVQVFQWTLVIPVAVAPTAGAFWLWSKLPLHGTGGASDELADRDIGYVMPEIKVTFSGPQIGSLLALLALSLTLSAAITAALLPMVSPALRAAGELIAVQPTPAPTPVAAEAVPPT